MSLLNVAARAVRRMAADTGAATPLVPALDGTIEPSVDLPVGGAACLIPGTNFIASGESLVSIFFGTEASPNPAIEDNTHLSADVPPSALLAEGTVDVIVTFSVTGALTIPSGFLYQL